MANPNDLLYSSEDRIVWSGWEGQKYDLREGDICKENREKMAEGYAASG